MHLADIMGTELMIPVIESYDFLVSPQQFASLDLVHLTLALYADKIFQNTASGTRLELRFDNA
jgi:hypothetical protein